MLESVETSCKSLLCVLQRGVRCQSTIAIELDYGPLNKGIIIDIETKVWASHMNNIIVHGYVCSKGFNYFVELEIIRLYAL